MTAPIEEQTDGHPVLEAYIAWRILKHQEDQESVAAWLALQMYPTWMIQRFTELDRSTPMWISAVLPLVRTAYLQSQRLAAVAYSDIRFAAEPDAEPIPMIVPDVERPADVPLARFDTSLIPRAVTSAAEALPGNVVDLDDYREPLVFDDFPMSDVATTLAINGNYQIKAAMPGPEEDLMYSGLANSAGAAVRQAMNGGRNVAGKVVYFDRRIVGYARVTDGDPCWFCAILASRGAVFKVDSFHAGGRSNPFTGALTKSSREFRAPKDAPELPEEYTNVARVHNHCRCSLRPVYRNERSYGDKFDPIRDEEAQFYFEQWEQVDKDWYWLSNREKLNKFREQYTPFRREAPALAEVRSDLLDRANRVAATPLSPQAEWTRQQLSALA